MPAKISVCNMLTAALFTAFSSTVLADNVPAPRGWDDTTVDGVRILKKDVTTIQIRPWQSLEGQTIDTWFESLENTPPEGAQFMSSRGVKTDDTTGAYSVLRTVVFGDNEGTSLLYACPGSNGYAQLSSMNITDSAFLDSMAGGMFIHRVCENAEQPDAHSLSAGQTPDSQSLSKETSQSSATAIKGSASSELLELRGILAMGIQADGTFGVTDDFIALFSDGSYTSDLATTFNDSIEASKNKKPKKWGTWRGGEKTLSLRGYNDNDFEETNGSWRIEPSPEDYRLSGCFGRLTSNSGGDYTSSTIVGVARTWCFWPDGRFTNSSAAFGSSSEVSMGVSDKARGSYRIDGYVAQFTYDDGHKITTAFGYASNKGDHVLINGRRFMGAKR